MQILVGTVTAYLVVPLSLFLYLTHCTVKSVLTSTAIFVCFGKLPITILSSSGTIMQALLNADTARRGVGGGGILCSAFSTAERVKQPIFHQARSKTTFIAIPWGYASIDLNKPLTSKFGLATGE